MYVLDDDKLKRKFDNLLLNEKVDSLDDLSRILGNYKLRKKIELQDKIMINGPLYPLIVVTRGLLNIFPLDPSTLIDINYSQGVFNLSLFFYEKDDLLFTQMNQFIKAFEEKYSACTNIKYFTKKIADKSIRYNKKIALSIPVAELNTYKNFN